jgi:RND family efflux transporter MFP subunit
MMHAMVKRRLRTGERAACSCEAEPTSAWVLASSGKPLRVLLVAAVLGLAGVGALAPRASGQSTTSTLTQNATSDAPVQPSAATPIAEWDSLATDFGGVKAETRPKLDTTMQFTFGTEVREIFVRSGARVKKDAMLVRARDAEVLAAIEQQKLLATSELEIIGTERQLELASFRFDRLKASKNFAATEFEESRIAVATAKVQRDQAVQRRDQARLALRQLEAQHERFFLQAPFDGIIEDVMVELGQGVNEQTKVLRLVNTDQLQLDAAADTDMTLSMDLKAGDRAWVLIDLPGKPAMVQGKVLAVSPVADSVSQTRRVRVEIENPKSWPAGTQAQVRFDAPGSNWASYEVRAARSDGAAAQVEGAARD